MPIEIISVQCEACKCLHSKTSQYLVIDSLEVHQKIAETASVYSKDHAPILSYKDIIVCNKDCLYSLLEQGRL